MASSSERYNIIYLAKLAALAERYDDMIDAMKKLVKNNIDLTAEERNLLSTAYKKVTEPKRESWKRLSTTKQKEDTIYKNETYIKCIQDYRNIVELDLANICYDVIILIDDHLLPFASCAESSVFYLKMAYQLAKEAFEVAMLELDDLGGKASSKDSKVILNLLRDNLTLWKAKNDERNL
uniref:14-3-3 domain-containing protein n=1 Tax=Chenopodium quinoa TaxID=63459 RepID=A0A803LYU3_CHEQI